MSSKRDFSAEERVMLMRMANHDPDFSEIIKVQIWGATVSSDPVDGRLLFDVGETLLMPIESGVVADSMFVDSDGIRVHMSLSVIDGKICDLSVWKEDGSTIQRDIRFADIAPFDWSAVPTG